LVTASSRTIDQLPGEGKPVALVIETHVREDKIQLFGFLTAEERDIFRLLQTVQGIGGKAAMAILSTLTPAQIIQAIAAQDKAMISRADGVGPKLALRVVTELKDKVTNIALTPSAANLNAPARGETKSTLLPLEEAISALVNLGYGRSEAYSAVARAIQNLGDTAKIEQIIPAALKEIAA
jgi:Holliday junction DNA helicase RuvA